ncbi:MAG: MFS transporter [Lachnospiraceae bacterium]|nr:MFS transporter [Lachnospiraceae bacterium]
MGKKSRQGYESTRKEYLAYCAFFLGQNLLWGFAGYIETFLTDIGIAAATAALILIVPKLWDAVNDVLFGYIVDRHVFKNGQKFVPWIRIGTSAVGVTTIALFAIPASMSNTVKVVWFLIAYILFDAAYTIQDTPAFAVTTVMTSNVEERTGIIAGGKLWAMVGGVVATVLIPMIRPRLGWLTACIVFIAVSICLMIPLLFSAKERHTDMASAEKNPDLKDMLHYLRHNKYLFVVLIAMLLLGLSSVEQKMAIYMGRICLGREDMATLIAAGVAVSVITVSAIVPVLSRKFDKFNILCFGLAFAITMDVVTYFVGYDNLVVALILIMLKCTGLGFWQVIIYMLIADTVEYGTYKSGVRAAGITFSLQCFVAKLKNALIGSIVLFSLSSIGFVEGENAVQPKGVSGGVWGLFNLLPAGGFALALLVLIIFYRLKSKDVQTMSELNNGRKLDSQTVNALETKYGKSNISGKKM